MKVIFLDFNGVLDTYENMNLIDEKNLAILKEVVEETNAKVVISSSVKNTFYQFGRHNSIMLYLLNELENYGIEVIGFTPYCEDREEEIKEYLKEHKEIDGYCIIDDDYYFESMKKHMVKLTSQLNRGNGLQESTKDAIIKILK